MRNVLLIARREYLEQIRGRAFKFSTVLVPLMIVGMMGASYFTGRNTRLVKHLAIAADSAPLADAVRSQLLNDKEAQFTVDVIAPASSQDRAALMDLVKSKAIDGLLDLATSPAGAAHKVRASRDAPRRAKK